MSDKVIFGLLLICLSWAVQPAGAQSNSPGTATQVPAPSGTVAPVPAGYGGSGAAPLVNYVRVRETMSRIQDANLYNGAGYKDVKETTSYVDGLGRPLQTVSRQITPGNTPADIVAPVVYDAFGREKYKYLPYPASSGNTSDGSFKLDPFAGQKSFYQDIYPAQQPAYTGEQVYYSQTDYEMSPLNRVNKAMAPGNSWAGSGNGVSQQYLVNTTDNVVMWNVGNGALTFVNNDISTNIPVSAGYYPGGELFKNVTIDEQGHAVVEYKDKEGQVILKKVQIGTVTGDYSGYDGWLTTYYVYDELNQLRFVIPPKAVALLAVGNSWDLSVDATLINELCFRYEYDGRKRMNAKKVPGADWVYMVYDRRDRLVFTQDANMRSSNRWMATLYDGLNRPTTTGMITYAGNRDQLQQAVYDNTVNGSVGSVTIDGSSPSAIQPEVSLSGSLNSLHQAQTGITLENGFETPDIVDFTAEIAEGGAGTEPFTSVVQVADNPLPPTPGFIPLTLTFYDDYSNLPGKNYTAVYNNLLDANVNEHAETTPTVADQRTAQTTGLVTGTKVRVLEDPADLTKGSWLTTTSFYDERGRVVQTQSDNYKGGAETVTNRYNFTGQVISSYLVHSNPAAAVNGATRIRTTLIYDHANRLLETYKTINDVAATMRLVARNEYDLLGQLKRKYVGRLPTGETFLETQDYSYNIRGWLKGINKDYATNDNSHGANDRWFGMELSYDWGFGSNQLNGNISGTKWRSKGDGQQRAYGFGYDAANRLLFGDFNQYTGGWNKTAGVNFTTLMGNGIDAASAYDENGNIKGMKQTGWQLGGSTLIDDLSYTYNGSSNKLKNVIDAQNKPDTKLGDFRTSSLSPYNTGKTSAAVDYGYDVNGNMTRDLNKDIGNQSTDGIVYNHLNLPWRVTVRGASGVKGTITYIYDAAGNKLQKIVEENGADARTTTTYIAGFQYQGKGTLSQGIPADELQQFGQEEGRVRVVNDLSSGQPVASYKYDYFLKDHLGNTRLVLTDEQQSDLYPAATMEDALRATEETYYSKLPETRTGLPAGYPTDGTTNPNNKVAGLSGVDGKKIGPGITLKVMAGDKFNIKVSSWYKLNGVTPGTAADPLSDLVTSLISGIGGLPGGAHPTPAVLEANAAPISTNMMDFLSDKEVGSVGGKPHAFVNWVLLDNQFNYVAESSGAEQVGTDNEPKQHILTDKLVTKSGYLYIYVSNETPNVSVFFDNLQVTHVRGPMLEETHYYPFGLTMAGISDKALKANYAENKYRFQKQELHNKEFSDGSGLEMYEYKYRFDDCQIGRFWSVDPLADNYPYNSTYAFSEDKVTTHVELEGLEADYIFSKAKRELANAFQGLANKFDKAVSVFNKSSSSTEVQSGPLTTTTTGMTVTTTTSTNAGGNMSYIIANNSNDGNPEPAIKTTVTVSVDTKTSINTPLVQMSQKTSIDNNGVVTNETAAKGNIKVNGAPVAVTASASTSTNGQTKVGIQGATGTGNTQAVGQVQYSTKGNQQGASIGVGVQVKAGNTTVSSIFGINFGW